MVPRFKRKGRIERKRKRISRIIVDAICNPHWRGRELLETTEDLINHAYRGGVDVLGPMPNTKKPLVTAQSVADYIEGCKQRVPRGRTIRFIPIVMLTEHTTREELERCVAMGIRDGKIYPYMRTTKSEHGIKNWARMLQVVRWCGELGIRVHVHFEQPNVTYIDREADYLCVPICEMFLQDTDAVLIWEHGSDGRCIPFWKQFAALYPGRFYVTLTAHHLMWNEDEASGDVRKRCKPPIKTEHDREALVRLVAEDHDWVMLGADDAAHDVNTKHVHEGQCSCGDFTSPFLIELCATALDRLLITKRGIRTFNNFASRNGRRLYGLPKASRQLVLERKPSRIPSSYKVGTWTVEPPGANKDDLLWTQVLAE